MLTVLALAMLTTLIVMLVTKRMSVMVALISVPLLFGLLGGFGTDLGGMVVAGMTRLAPTGIMLGFAILYFSVMSDAGLFDPLIRTIVRWAHGDPLRVVVGSAILALVVSLDGDGSTTYLICAAAFMPLYRRMGLDTYILASLLILSCGITNLVPWGGPTARIASALNLDVMDVFVPMIPSMIGAMVMVLLLAWWWGLKERKRLGVLEAPVSDEPVDLSFLDRETARPRLALFNALLTTLLIAGLVTMILPLPVLFMIAAAIALALNYPDHKDQLARIREHAPSILNVMLIIFSVSVLVGVLEGTRMSAALGQSVVAVLPDWIGPYLAPVNALISMPLTYFMSNSSYFFGVLPIISEAGKSHGIAPVEMARSVLIGQPLHLLSPMVASSYLCMTLTEVEFGKLLRFALKWSFATSMVMLVIAFATGVIPFRAGL